MQKLGFNYGLTEAQKHSSVMVKVPDCLTMDLGSIPGQVSKFFGKSILTQLI